MIKALLIFLIATSCFATTELPDGSVILTKDEIALLVTIKKDLEAEIRRLREEVKELKETLKRYNT